MCIVIYVCLTESKLVYCVLKSVQSKQVKLKVNHHGSVDRVHSAATTRHNWVGLASARVWALCRVPDALHGGFNLVERRTMSNLP